MFKVCILIFIQIFLFQKQKKILFLNFFYLFISIYLFIYNLFFKQYFFIYNYFFINFDIFGIVLYSLAIITQSFCFLFLDIKIYKNLKKSFIIFWGFNFILLLFFFTNNILIFFICYELLLFISIILTYFSSPNLRAKLISLYFLLWTQLGSFFVLIAVLLILYNIDNFNFFQLSNFKFTNTVYLFIQLLLFIGFGIKIPMWPFHFWLTKTHVEVNTSFSIFLSGILVKTALFGFYKFNFFFLKINYIFLIFLFFGILDSCLKLMSQVDIKKIVAYCTIFEMNIILFNFIFFSYYSYLFFIYFSILHTLLSFYFFFLVDCLYRRYNSRSITSITNILNLYPNLGLFLIIGVFLFNGIPLTLKFNLEIIFLEKLLNFNIVYFIIFLIIHIVCVIFFSKNWFNLLFFSSINKYTSDLTLKEICIFLLLIFFFIFFSFF